MSQPVRAAAAQVIARVLDAHESLQTALPALSATVASADQALLQELSYGTLRHAPALDCIVRHLVQRNLPASAATVRALLLLGLYQLREMRIGAHAAVDLSVAACRTLGAGWATGLVNAVLRRYLRERESIDAILADAPAYRFQHPAWLIDRIRAAWPQDWVSVLQANNQRPPMVLRVNRTRSARAEIIAALAAAGIPARATVHGEAGIVLETPLPVEALPGFAEGACSVQDGAAQLAAPLLDPVAGSRILDACAAPGGKTAHLLELAGTAAHCLALDIDPERQQRTRATLARLGHTARIVTADACAVDTWWDGVAFDRILIDAPCSGTGVIRRHPDIKFLRRASDIDALVARQRALLEALWPLLAARGKLLYTTCSVLPTENDEQVAAFLARHPEIRATPVTAPWGRRTRYGRQILTGEDGMDGFFFALLEHA